MSNAKAEVQKLLEKMPENASFDDIQYHIYVRQKLERGLADVDEGRVVDDADVGATVVTMAGRGKYPSRRLRRTPNTQSHFLPNSLRGSSGRSFVQIE